MVKSVFLQEVGDTEKNRVWSFLIVHSEYDYSMKEIARHSKVGYTTLKVLWKDFRQKKTVIETRTVGRAKMYKLNLKNPVVGKFIDYYWAVVDSVVRKDTKTKDSRDTGSSLSGAVAVSARNV
ncbi:MAG TPA: hypothetical protein VI564_00215 [Candidatus Nanoarchaeia archaeon]|nr:hypothetical protein [Candidatus Nanoarchaeia archaeon]